MGQMQFRYVQDAITEAGLVLKNFGKEINPKKWQGVESPDSMWEVLFHSFIAMMPQSIEEMQAQTKCDLPWAEDHFQERVGGLPLNPGEQYKKWPYYKFDEKWRVDDKFSHTYMERYWPKVVVDSINGGHKTGRYMQGIRYHYGDLRDVITLLINEPFTRQAYLPVWFPEDTGAVHGGRVPCTIGYLFIMRNNQLHVEYHIRACDYLRHFRNDIYLTMRLARWLLDELKLSHAFWAPITLGTIVMHIGSFHVFSKERKLL